MRFQAATPEAVEIAVLFRTWAELFLAQIDQENGSAARPADYSGSAARPAHSSFDVEHKRFCRCSSKAEDCHLFYALKDITSYPTLSDFFEQTGDTQRTAKNIVMPANMQLEFTIAGQYS